MTEYASTLLGADGSWLNSDYTIGLLQVYVDDYMNPVLSTAVNLGWCAPADDHTKVR